LLATLGVVTSEIAQITAVAAGLQFAVLGAIFIAFEVLIDGTVGLTAGRLGTWPSRRRRARQALDAGSGTIMVALAGRLALER
jgi:threonine/homoserine/homoserine lactone efflux protein